jgi:D-alanyl-D-alanine carboxypeptidase (penicillin-binding protein 5/6)
MARRDRGEKITNASNLFEPTAAGPVTRPPIGQGDAEQQGLQIVLTNNPAKPAPVALRPSVSVAKGAPKGRWGIQVGAFKQRNLANTQIKLIEKRFSDVVASAEGVVEQAGGNYRAQFTGLGEGAARTACRALVAKRQVCLVLTP